MTFRPRPKQEEVLAYRGGKMGIAAVPGSGKTVTLSCLAAKLVAEGGLDDDQEVLIVTLVNSAVEHFARQVAGFVRERGLLPNLGYRVCTLHSLAHDIVRERPGLVGLAEDFAIVDESEASRILQEVATSWLQAHSPLAEGYLDPILTDAQRQDALRRWWPGLMKDIAEAVVKRAKDSQLSPEALQELIEQQEQELPLLQAACDIYADYQRALAYRGAVDFDDLIRLALDALQLDPDLRVRLHHRWPYVLEDEAQDSSRLQEEILRLLVGPEGNWVRVGDPNQAIYDTFTTADPRYLREFLEEADVQRRELPNSGRSTPSIIALANYLIDWTRQEHPVEALRDALSLPHIEPTPPGDSQPNPPDAPDRIFLSLHLRTPAEECRLVARKLAQYLADAPDATVAALVSTNSHGSRLVEELRRLRVPYVELLRSTMASRDAASLLAAAVAHLADPTSQSKLAALYHAWHSRLDGHNDCDPEDVARAIRRCRYLEELLHAQPGTDWLEGAPLDPDSATSQQLQEFRDTVTRWQEAVLLPADQLVLTLAQDLFDEPADLAVAHKLAVHLRRGAQANPGWRLPDLYRELSDIATNRRKFMGFSEDDTGFDPEQHRGKVVVATIHKAKGLEWDRVYLLSANNYDFPSGQAHDSYRSEPWFVRDHLNLEAEVEAQLEQVMGGPHPRPLSHTWERGEGIPPSFSGKGGWGVRSYAEARAQPHQVTGGPHPRPLFHTWERGEGIPLSFSGKGGRGVRSYAEGEASREARIRYCAERLRLLYVGITRAKKELVVTCNSGSKGDMRPAAPLIALCTWWEENRHGSAT